MDHVEDQMDSLLKECNPGVVDHVRASQIVKQFAAIKEEHANILQEMEDLKASHQQTVKEILSELQLTVHSVEKLKSTVGDVEHK